MRLQNVRSFFSVFFFVPCGMIHTSEVQSRCFLKKQGGARGNAHSVCRNR